jgi:glycosyltransferase involved in cell wall biosynthesis
VRRRAERTRPDTPDEFVGLAPEVLERLRWCVHPRFYLAQLAHLPGPDRGELGELGDDADVDAVIGHFLAHGAAAGLRISAFFNPEWYAERLAELDVAVPDGEVPFVHWLTLGWERKVVPTPLVDEAWYLEHHPGLASHPRWIFHHYLTRGCYQPQWQPSPAGTHHGGWPDDEAVQRQDPLLLPELLHRADEHDLSRTSWLEEGVLAVLRKRQRLDAPELREQIAKAAELEPRLHAPLRPELPTVAPPHAHQGARMAAEVAAARRSLGLDQVDTVVLVPHCRLSGAARVAGVLTEAVRATSRPDSVVVISTDLPVWERPGLFPQDVPILHVTPHIAGMAQPARRDLLADLLVELGPRRVIVVNSLLGWQVIAEAGDRLAKVMDLGAYLFTWEVDQHGHRYGFPIGPLQQSLEHLSWVLLDSERLRTELVERYLMPAAARARLHFLRTPLADFGSDVTGGLERRRAAGEPLRALWAGRFDRSKRFDIVVEVARMMPEMQIWAWGKPVLSDLDVDLDDLPPNIRLMGVYESFDQLPLDDVDFLFYTSGLDGIPNVVMEGAQTGLPVVASAVGGVPEVITPETGYPVVDVDDPSAYVAAIKALLTDPAAATRRSALLREHVHRLFTTEQYHAEIARLFADRTGS